MLIEYPPLIKSRSHFFFFGGQGHPGRARGTQGKARGPPGSPGYPFPGFPLGPPGPPWVPLASKKEKMGSGWFILEAVDDDDEEEEEEDDDDVPLARTQSVAYPTSTPYAGLGRTLSAASAGLKIRWVSAIFFD